MPTAFQRDAPEAGAGREGLRDLRRERDWRAVEAQVDAALEHKALASRGIVLDFADGQRWFLTPAQRWRFWRRALRRLDA